MDESYHCTVGNLISRTFTPQLSLIYFLLPFKLSVKSHIFFEFLPKNIGEKNNFFSEFIYIFIYNYFADSSKMQQHSSLLFLTFLFL